MPDTAPSASRRDFLRSAAVAAVAGALPSQASLGARRPGADGVLELRQYTLHRGQRDVLIAMFEREFLAPLNEAGAYVRGAFVDLDDPDRFVWIRGFTDLPSRQRALEAFYGGAVWQRHRNAANATMLDSDNVLLLRPAQLEVGATVIGAAPDGGIVSAFLHSLNGTPPDVFREFYRYAIRPRLVDGGAHPVLELETEPAPNNYPRLPVRTDASFAWFARWPGAAELQAFQRYWKTLSGWRDGAPEAVLPALMRKPEVLRLQPTASSELR